VYDVRGTRIDWIAADATGSGALQWRPAASVGSGVYFVRMTGPGLDVAKRVTLVR